MQKKAAGCTEMLVTAYTATGCRKSEEDRNLKYVYRFHGI
jgi:hypothetical protein